MPTDAHSPMMPALIRVLRLIALYKSSIVVVVVMPLLRLGKLMKKFNFFSWMTFYITLSVVGVGRLTYKGTLPFFAITFEKSMAGEGVKMRL